MRKFLNVIAVAILLVFSACESDDIQIEEKAGDIPGMGNANGQLQVTDFNLPSGVEIVGEISGILGDEGVVAQEYSSLKSTKCRRYYGCGGRDIQVLLKIKNNVDRARSCFFPPGLIFKVNDDNHQNAMNLCWTWVCFKPYEEREIVLHLFCINHGRLGSLLNTRFEILGVTTSPLMRWLLRRCNLRRLNYECFPLHNPKASLKTGDTYNEITGVMQEAIWSLTNGDGLSEEHEEFIDALPMLDADQLPPGIEELDFEPPYYWDEYAAEYVAE